MDQFTISHARWAISARPPEATKAEPWDLPIFTVVRVNHDDGEDWTEMAMEDATLEWYGERLLTVQADGRDPQSFAEALIYQQYALLQLARKGAVTVLGPPHGRMTCH